MKQGDNTTHQPLLDRGPRTRLWVTGCLLLLIIVLIWKASSLLLLLLASVLLALLLGGVSQWVCRRTRLSYRLCLALVVAVLLAVLCGLGFLLAPDIGKQTAQLQTTLPRALEHMQKQISRYGIGAQLVSAFQAMGAQAQPDQLVPKAASALHAIVGAVGGLLVLVFVALYLAADPRRYVMAVVSLFSPPKRHRAKEVLYVLGGTLQRWLVGRLILMAINGVVTTIGLSVMQVPMALTLGILSGLLNFIPNFGPIIAAVPAILVAFLQGPDKALYVLIFYVVYQNIDGYVLEPQVEKRTVSLAPAITIVAQVLLGLLFGTMGVLLAAPFAAIIVDLLKMLYLEDVLGEPVTLPTDHPK